MTYTYDNDGNVLTKTDSTGTTTYTWDFENRLTSVALPGSGGTVSFKYDPFGRRIQKSSGSGTINYVYDNSNVLEEVDNSGNVLARYTQGLGVDEPLAETRSGTTSYYEADGLGSITSLSNSSGTLAATYTYDSFGNLTGSTGTLTNPYRYTGRDFDSETGLYYYRARYYDTASARFLSEDPIRLNGGINLYTYVRNSPIDRTDPEGLCADKGDTNKLASCISSLFGVATIAFVPSQAGIPGQPGSFTGIMAGIFTGVGKPRAPGPAQFTVTNYVSKTAGALTTTYILARNTVSPGQLVTGLTEGSNPFVNYTAEGLSADQTLQTQIWELGNSLGFLTGRTPSQVNTSPGSQNTEPGNWLLTCYNSGN